MWLRHTSAFTCKINVRQVNHKCILLNYFSEFEATNYHFVFEVRYRCFNTVIIKYRFLHSHYPEYLLTFIKTRHYVYNPCKDQADSVLLEVPHFTSSVYKSTKHFDARCQFCFGCQKDLE